MSSKLWEVQSIEFLNFMLLSDLDKSRLNKIPKDVYKDRSGILLDIEISGMALTIKRDLNNPTDIIFVEKDFHHALNIVDARKYILSKFKFKSQNLYCTFRNLVQPLSRDERCEFKSIPDYSDTKSNVPVDYKSHMFYLGLDNSSLNSAMHTKGIINTEKKVKTKIQQQVELLSGKSIRESRVELNLLNKQKSELDELIKNQDFSVFDKLDDKFQDINLELKKIRTKTSLNRTKIKQAQALIVSESVDVETVRAIYSKIRNSLANEITRNLGYVIDFKRKIESYTNNVVSRKMSDLQSEIELLEERRDFLLIERDKYKSEDCDVEYDMNEAIGNLAILDKLINDIERHLNRVDELDKFIKRKKIELDEDKLNLELQLQEHGNIIKSFEKKALTVHESLFDDYSASFGISVNNRKEVISFDMRIKEDGGHSNERAKVFIYDFSLLLHDKTYSNHLGFLIHDNIFDNDNDTLQKALNYIEKTLIDVKDRQYILTLNSDKLDNLELDFDMDTYRRAKFTKSKKFLNCTYEEL